MARAAVLDSQAVDIRLVAGARGADAPAKAITRDSAAAQSRPRELPGCRPAPFSSSPTIGLRRRPCTLRRRRTSAPRLGVRPRRPAHLPRTRDERRIRDAAEGAGDAETLAR